jgi:hypothetical protein
MTVQPFIFLAEIPMIRMLLVVLLLGLLLVDVLELGA